MASSSESWLAALVLAVAVTTASCGGSAHSDIDAEHSGTPFRAIETPREAPDVFWHVGTDRHRQRSQLGTVVAYDWKGAQHLPEGGPDELVTASLAADDDQTIWLGANGAVPLAIDVTFAQRQGPAMSHNPVCSTADASQSPCEVFSSDEGDAWFVRLRVDQLPTGEGFLSAQLAWPGVDGADAWVATSIRLSRDG